MKIILISPQYFGTITGSGGLYALELSRELAIRNYDVTVLTMGIKDAKEEETVTLNIPKLYKKKNKCKVKVKRFFAEDSRTISSPFEGRKEEEIKRLKNFNQSVLDFLYSQPRKKTIIHLNGHFMIPSLAKEIKKLSQYKIVTSMNTIESISEAKKEKDGAGRRLINFIKAKEKDALLFSDYIILWSNALKEEISWVYPDIYKKARIKVIPFGIPSNFIVKNVLNNEKSDLLKDKYNISNDFIFNLNRIDPSKGIEYLILGFPKLIKKLRKHYGYKSLEFSLLIAGFLEDKNTWYYNKLKKLIEKIKDKEIRKCIQINTNPSVIADKEYLHKISKLFVMPSIVSPFGMSMIEAIIKGSPFVVSGVEGILDILNISNVEIPFSNVQGGAVVNFLNPVTRTDYLVDALFYVLTNYPKAQSSIMDLQKKLINRYSWKKIIEENISIYKKLMGKKGK